MYASLISYRAFMNPQSTAMITDDGAVSYSKLNAWVEHAARTLAPMLPASRAVVAVNLAQLPLHWIALLALARLGHVSVSIGKDDLPANSNASLILTDQAEHAGQPSYLLLTPEWWEAVRTAPAQRPLPERAGWDDPARIMLTSGTTGQPRRVLLTHRMLMRRFQSDMAFYGISASSRYYMVMKPGSLAGFVAPMETWMAGGSIVFSTRPPLIQELVQLDITAIGMATGQLASMIRNLPADFAPRPDLKVVVGGSLLTKTLADEAAARLTPNILVAYGSTEVGTVAGAPAAAIDTEANDVGRVIPEAQLQIVDDNDRVLPFGKTGIVRVRSTSGITAYDGDPEASAAVFRDGWFYPGDLGALSAGGILRVTGRAAEVMNLGGNKIAPELIEELVRSYPAVRDVAAFAAPNNLGIDQLWIAVVRAPDFDEAALIQILAPKIQGKVRALYLAAIPRNDMGKIRRDELKKMVATDQPTH
jgi:acyl-CoA synthetase (AMP-forming)/AMP-acid ligase II